MRTFVTVVSSVICPHFETGLCAVWPKKEASMRVASLISTVGDETLTYRYLIRRPTSTDCTGRKFHGSRVPLRNVITWGDQGILCLASHLSSQLYSQTILRINFAPFGDLNHHTFLLLILKIWTNLFSLLHGSEEVQGVICDEKAERYKPTIEEELRMKMEKSSNEDREEDRVGKQDFTKLGDPMDTSSVRLSPAFPFLGLISHLLGSVKRSRFQQPEFGERESG